MMLVEAMLKLRRTNEENVSEETTWQYSNQNNDGVGYMIIGERAKRARHYQG